MSNDRHGARDIMIHLLDGWTRWKNYAKLERDSKRSYSHQDNTKWVTYFCVQIQ